MRIKRADWEQRRLEWTSQPLAAELAARAAPAGNALWKKAHKLLGSELVVSTIISS